MPSQPRSSRRLRGYPTATEIRGRRISSEPSSYLPCMGQDRVDSLLTHLTPLRGYPELAERAPTTNNSTPPARSSTASTTSATTTPTTRRAPVCHFFAMNGSCRNGIHCTFSHDVTPGDTRSIPCSFFFRKNGNCRYGDSCRFSHDANASRSEHHPDDEEATEAKNTVCQPCNTTTSSSADNDEDDDLICGICMEHPTKFGLLSGCDHVFCFECLMEWRSSSTGEEQQQQNKALVKVCPICRTHSDYVLSSFTFAKTGNGKEDLMVAHKYRLSQIPCKRFNGELGSCPFGRDCFYQHVDEYGNDVKRMDLSMQDIQEELERRKRRRQRHYHLESQRQFDSELDILEAQLALLQLGLASFAFQLDI